MQSQCSSVDIKNIMARAKKGRSIHTDLCPHHLCQSTDELWRSVDAQLDGLLVHDFSNGQPKGGFEALKESAMQLPRMAHEMIYLFQPDLFGLRHDGQRVKCVELHNGCCKW